MLMHTIFEPLYLQGLIMLEKNVLKKYFIKILCFFYFFNINFIYFLELFLELLEKPFSSENFYHFGIPVEQFIS